MTESDIIITEGLSRQIPVRRRNLDSSTVITVFVTTIDGYRQNTQTNCSIALSMLLGVDESQVDPAEGECTSQVLTNNNNNHECITVIVCYVELLYVIWS